MQSLILQPCARTAAQLHMGEQPCCSGRSAPWPVVPRLQQRGLVLQPLQPRRRVALRAEWSRDPRGSGGSGGGPAGGGPATQQPGYQEPWADSYQYAPLPNAAQPPRLPPNGGNGSGPGGGDGGGLSNLTKAFIAGAFILGGREGGPALRSPCCCKWAAGGVMQRMPGNRQQVVGAWHGTAWMPED